MTHSIDYLLYLKLKVPSSLLNPLNPQDLTAYIQTLCSSTIGPLNNLIQGVFATCKIPESLNQTYICLIPKVTQATTIKYYRPIGLCNTTFKIITKIIANRIKPLLPSLISHEQLAFLPQR